MGTRTQWVLMAWVAWGSTVVGSSGCGGTTEETDAGRLDVGALDTGRADGAVADATPSDVPSDVSRDAPTDGGRCATDAGMPTGDCVLRVPVGSFGPLTASCLPRCSVATATAYRACTTQACRNAAVGSDTTPGTEYYVGSVRVSSPMDCGACVSYQEFHCFSLVCGEEVDDYVDDCIAGVNPDFCDARIAAVDACLAAATPADEAILDACYASVDGPEGCFPCE